jgi:hypothetical protein
MTELGSTIGDDELGRIIGNDELRGKGNDELKSDEE